MDDIKLQSNSAQRIYNDYIKRVNRCTRILNESDRDDIANEIRSHIFEGLQAIKYSDEIEGLLTVIDKLGAPEEFLIPIITNKKILQASSTFNPKHVVQALRLSAMNSARAFVFGIFYLFLFLFPFLIIMKIVDPENTGLFLIDGKRVMLGIADEVTPNMNELLGRWFIPVMIVLTVLFYGFLTRLLRMIKRK